MSLRKSAQLMMVALVIAVFGSTANADSTQPVASSAAVFETKMALRDLWVEHVFWIRNYVLAYHAGDEKQRDAAETQVVANAKALAQSIELFYGGAASEQLFTLLAGHWGAVKSYNEATAAGSQPEQKRALDQLTTNAHQIADFLSGANPFLPSDTVFGLLAAHGSHHVSQISDIKAGEFEHESQTWAAMRSHMLVIADAIAGALAQQFPDRFSAHEG